MSCSDILRSTQRTIAADVDHVRPRRTQAKLKSVVVSLLCLAVTTYSGAVTTEFPDGATALTTASLQEAVGGKSFNVVPDSGPDWKWEFGSDGYFTISIGQFYDKGKWSAKDSALCTEGRKITASCNEVRQSGNALYLKRDNGNVVQMNPK